MARSRSSSTIRSITSHVLVAAITTVIVGNLFAMSHHPDPSALAAQITVLTTPAQLDLSGKESLIQPQESKDDEEEEKSSVKSKEEKPAVDAEPLKVQKEDAHHQSEEQQPKKLISSRIDVSSCPSKRLMISPKVNFMVGMGHKTTEALWFFWFAMTRGYCYCFSPQHFGSDSEIYTLLLEPLLPKCPADRTLKDAQIKDFTKTKFDVDKEIAFLSPDMGQVWPGSQKTRPPGFGDVLAFVDHFLQDNHLIQERIYPWYQQHKTIKSAFRQNDNDDKLIRAAFHLRVGDVVLEAKEEYWRNVLRTLRSIIDMEYGSDYKIEVYWLYFQAMFRGGIGDSMRNRLSKNQVGHWPSEDRMLPPSHLFLSKICKEIPNFECLWKEGTNIQETIDLFVESDVVYASGSSFSQVLTLFQRKEHGIKLLALPKELNYWGKAERGSVPFLQTHTGAFANLRYYYLDGTGEVFSEQLNHLKWKGLGHKAS